MKKEKIKLNADESMLLLITKSWLHKDVPLDGRDRDEYIQACCDHRCNFVGANVFTIYLELCIKLLSPYRFANILNEFNNNAFWERLGYEPRTLVSLMISELANRIITDLELDTSLVFQPNV